MRKLRFASSRGDRWEFRRWTVPTTEGYHEIAQLEKNGEEVGRNTYRRDVLGRLLGYETIGTIRVPSDCYPY